MEKKGIIVYTVGVGFDTNEEFMSKLAQEGNGIYFRPEASERLRMEFEEKSGEEEKDKYKIDVYNKYHFITQSIDLPDTSIGNYNDVTPKSIAQVLITTESKKPIVTVWRFGLGRVASVTTDDGLKWSPGLYSAQNGRLVSAITNWAIGDLEKKKEVKIESTDVAVGREASVYVKSDSPALLYVQKDSGPVSEVPLKQVDIRVYSGRFTPNETGVYSLKASNSLGTDTDAVAVNYQIEYSRLGTDRQGLADITGTANGKSYTASQIDQLTDDALEYIKEGMLKESKEKVPLQMYFAIAALSLFFIDVVIRRIKEINRLKSM